ncbi:hypothetical protein EVAR_61459_1 [Eumeta japonica]|uniref:Uncharacterized protein n=1 Tax=Eumeta variegata TaxID=151549 RepID=A0A4C1Z244_EUMVA|nr:hypothetical protein EVAR_61459_1 [Eumeta japonica]
MALGCLSFAGLTEKYLPMTMAIENSRISISTDAIKTKLLDMAETNNIGGNESTAFASHKKFQHKNKNNKSTYCISSLDETYVPIDSGDEDDEDMSVLAKSRSIRGKKEPERYGFTNMCVSQETMDDASDLTLEEALNGL